MYQPSQAYLDFIDNRIDRTPLSKVVVDGIEYDGRDPMNGLKTFPKISHVATSMIGGFPAKTVDFEIWNRDRSISLNGKEVEVWRGLEIADGVRVENSDIISTAISGWMSDEVTITIITISEVRRVQINNPASLDFINNNYPADNGDGTNTFITDITALVSGLLDPTFLRIASYISDWTEEIPVQDALRVEWIPMGIFSAADEDIKNSDTGLHITFHGFDRSTLLNAPYEGELEYPTTLGAFVQEICDRRGLALETPQFPLYEHIMLGRPNIPTGYLERELVSRAAELGGCIAQISREGGLRIEGPQQTGRTISRQLYKSLNLEKAFPPINSVGLGHERYEDSMVVEDDAAVAENGRSFWLVADNPFVDLWREYWLEDVAAQLFGMTVVPFKLTELIDDFIYDLNDVVMVETKDGSLVQTSILQLRTTARIRSEFATETQNGGIANLGVAGSLRQQMREVRLEVDHNLNAIISYVSENFADKGFVQTIIEQLSSQITFWFNSTNNMIDQLENGILENQGLLQKYIRFYDGKIELGELGNDLSIEINNERIIFRQGGQEISFVAGRMQHILDVKIQRYRYTDNWVEQEEPSGNLTLSWMGG